jgi:hypothetical protein
MSIVNKRHKLWNYCYFKEKVCVHYVWYKTGTVLSSMFYSRIRSSQSVGPTVFEFEFCCFCLFTLTILLMVLLVVLAFLNCIS